MILSLTHLTLQVFAISFPIPEERDHARFFFETLLNMPSVAEANWVGAKYKTQSRRDSDTPGRR